MMAEAEATRVLVGPSDRAAEGTGTGLAVEREEIRDPLDQTHLDELIDQTLPQGIRQVEPLAFGPALSEQELLVEMRRVARECVRDGVDVMKINISGDEFVSHARAEITPLEGESFLPALQGRKWDRGQPITVEHEGNRAVRLGKWKLVALANRPWELYDFEADRTEMRNLATDFPETVKKLVALWEDWAAINQVTPLPNDYGVGYLKVKIKH